MPGIPARLPQLHATAPPDKGHVDKKITLASFYHPAGDTCVHTKPQRVGCDYILSYSARRSWDVVPYLTQAKLRILGPERREVARADYHLRGKGGLSLLKWQGTKMDPVIDQLLAQVSNTPRRVPASEAPAPPATAPTISK